MTAGIAMSMPGCSSSPDKQKQQYQKELIKQELKYGRLLASQILKTYPTYDDDELRKYVNLVGKGVAMYGGRNDFEYKFEVLDTPQINAFATPGGYIFVTKGAIYTMQSEAELAGTLAHEVAHVNRKHIMREIPPPREKGGFVNTLARVLTSQTATASAAFSEAVKQAEKTLFVDGYKRKDEFDADRFGTIYLSETGYAPDGLVNFLTTIAEKEKNMGKEAVYHTHPSTAERIKRIRDFLKESNYSSDIKLKERFEKYTRNLRLSMESS